MGDLVGASKFLSLVLRHRPDAIGLQLDAAGWASLDDLVRLSIGGKTPLTRELILEVVHTSDKQRFALTPDGSRIRANQGHSVEVDLGLAPSEPPPVLYHGTATRFLAAIRRQGLRPMARQHVHLSAEHGIAESVGARHGAAVVLVVDAAAMRGEGIEFYRADNGVWLTAVVPPRFLRGQGTDSGQ
ncbi:MAG: RNA 2'-phosphotransferase [Planctomycetes bacterium]|nr:RNA 2'-phosphotransferase [Planctomycetota bacterium]